MSLNEEEQKQVTAYAELGAAIHFTLVELRNFEHLAEAQALEDQWKRARNYIDNHLPDPELYKTEFDGIYVEITIAVLLLRKMGRESHAEVLHTALMKFSKVLVDFFEKAYAEGWKKSNKEC